MTRRNSFLGLNPCCFKPFFLWVFVFQVIFSPSFIFAAKDEKKEPSISQDKFQVNLPGRSASERNPFDQLSVQKIQESLKTIGYDIGETFGLIDKKTSAAVRKFREDFEIVSDDLFSDHLISTLFHYAEVAKVHPDWKDITLSKSFTDWINKQPTKEQVRISKLRRSGSAKQIVTLLNAYKADQKKAEAAAKPEKKKVVKVEVEKTEAKKEETPPVLDVKTLSISVPIAEAVTKNNLVSSKEKSPVEEKNADELVSQKDVAAERSEPSPAPESEPEKSEASLAVDSGIQQDSGGSGKEASFQTILEQAKDLRAFDPSKLVTWEGDDCGCLVDLSGKTIYGFYPFWLAGEPQKIDFSLLSRIAYYALSFDKKGEMSPLLHWHSRTADFVREAQRYRTKVDLVIYKNDWSDWFHFSKKDQWFVIDKTTRNIVQAVHQKIPDTLETRIKSLMSSKESTTMGDGVTIYFSKYPKDKQAITFFKSFIQTLRRKLGKANPNYKLNLMFRMDVMGEGIYAFETLKEIMNDIDLFLIILPKKKPISDTKKALRTSFEKDPTFTGDARKTMLRKIIPVIDPRNNDLDENKSNEDKPFVHHIIYFEDNFGGVGFWPLPLTSDQGAVEVAKVLNDKFNKTKDLDLLSRLIPEESFSLCKWICPNRWYFRLAYDLLFSLLFLYALIALQNTALRNIFNQYRQFFILTVLLAILILYSAVICDPYLNGKKDEVTLGLIFVGIFFWIWRNYIQMKEAKYP
ncbi:hypothetical protein MNBD_NITROSPIRAE01-1077 [hydrothermal vent metagenome]|uniref:Peptidoglycan binding-like domain-containing protein n=1 Tax=hydrothermal vent metagenome TaxID=652676 RepID=A0A3B1CY15_9ZZZZ